MKKFLHVDEFSKNATYYNRNAKAQIKIAKDLTKNITCKGTVLDIGCGCGNVYRSFCVKPSQFFGIDLASGMLDLHPKAPHITLKQGDFENNKSWIKNTNANIIVSSCAIQWAKNIDQMLEFLHSLGVETHLAIPTNGTFLDIYKSAKKPPWLPSALHVEKNAKKLWGDSASCYTKYYKEFFDNKTDIFRYIQKNGLKGGGLGLHVGELRMLIKSYPHKYLEYEIIFVHVDI